MRCQYGIRHLMRKLIVFPSQERALSERTPVPPENASPNIEAMIPHGAMKSKLSNIGGTENSATPKNLQRPTKSNVEATEHIVDTWRNQSANVKCISPLADAVLLRSSGLITKQAFTLPFISNKRAS